jgi:hypothetical protein
MTALIHNLKFETTYLIRLLKNFLYGKIILLCYDLTSENKVKYKCQIFQFDKTNCLEKYSRVTC